MALSVGLLLFLVLILAFFATAAYAGFSAAPFLPTRWRDVRRCLDLATLTPGERVVDLGCGDGRFVVEAARRGAHAVGYEVSLLPYLWARARILLAGRMPGTARVELKNFYGVDLSTVDLVLCFLTPMAMQKLSTKVAHELGPRARLVSVAFHLPGFVPVANDYPGGFVSRVYVYRRGTVDDGTATE